MKPKAAPVLARRLPAALCIALAVALAGGAAAKPPSGFRKVDNYWIGPLSNPLFGKSPADDARPDVLIHAPPRYSFRGSVDLVIYFHGMRNCILNAAANKGCVTKSFDPGQGLIAQFDKSGMNAVLVLLQGVYNQSKNETRLENAQDGFFLEFVNGELLPLVQKALASNVQVQGTFPLGKLTLAGHSGAYVPLQKVLQLGGLDDKVPNILLLDSLYSPGGWPGALATWHAARSDGRMVAVCNDTKGNIDLVVPKLQAKKLQTWKGESRDPPASLGPETFQFFKSSMAHPTIPGKWFGPLLTLLQKPPSARAPASGGTAASKSAPKKPAPKKKPQKN